MKKREELQVNVAGLRRNIKNLAHNYSDAQVKVREATSNDHWGPNSTLMSEIADLTYNVVAFTEIMQMIWKRLNDHGRNWRHVYKALLLLEYLIKTGSEKVAQQCKENIYAIRTLRDFQHFEDGKDPGLNVREKAKQLVLLLMDDEKLRNERIRAFKAKERFAQSATAFGSDTTSGKETWSSCSTSNNTPTKVEMECARPQTAGEEELQLQLALAMSREEAEQEEQKRKSDDVRLQLALSQSEKEFKHVQHVPSAQQSHINDLLEIDALVMNPRPPLVDPWGSIISAPTTVAPSIPKTQSDPWNTSSPLSSPLSVPSHSATPITSTSSDPWMPVTNNQMQFRKTDDPWSVNNVENTSSPSPPNLPARPVDPWAPIPSSGTSSKTNEDHEFSTIINRSTPFNNQNGAGTSVSPDPFDLTSLENGLSNSPVPRSNSRNATNSPHIDTTKKTPQAFLGENSSLVNLDNLITTPAVPPLPAIATQKTGVSNTNPFGNVVGSSTLFNKSAAIHGNMNAFQGDPFQPIQARSSSNALPQPLLPQPNPFLS